MQLMNIRIFIEIVKLTEFEDTKGVNQNPSVEEEHTTQWPREQTTICTENKRSMNTKPTKFEVELRCSGRVRSYWSTSGSRRVASYKNQVIRHFLFSHRHDLFVLVLESNNTWFIL